MRKLRRGLASWRNARNRCAPEARVPPLLPSTQRNFTTGLLAWVSLSAPSRNGPVRSCFERSFRYT